MLFPDIKAYFIEQESEEDEGYLFDLEECRTLNDLLQVVGEYHNIDDLETAMFIFNKVCS